MKKILIIYLLATMFVGCGTKEEKEYYTLTMSCYAHGKLVQRSVAKKFTLSGALKEGDSRAIRKEAKGAFHKCIIKGKRNEQ